MGDVGSGFLGFTLTVLAIATQSTRRRPNRRLGDLGGSVFGRCFGHPDTQDGPWRPMAGAAPYPCLSAPRAALAGASAGDLVGCRHQHGLAVSVGMVRFTASGTGWLFCVVVALLPLVALALFAGAGKP